MEPLAEALRVRGCTVAVPVVTGLAGGSRRVMRRHTFEDWIRVSEEAFKELCRQSDTVVIAGFSTGGLIAVLLAEKFDPAAVVLMSVPVRHWDLKRVIINVTEDLKRSRLDHVRHYVKSAVKFPIRALLEFKRLQSHTLARFRQVRCPALIVQGLDDDTVHWKSAARIQAGIQGGHSGAAAELAYFEPAGHVILHGPAGQPVVRLILKFLEDSCIL